MMIISLSVESMGTGEFNVGGEGGGGGRNPCDGPTSHPGESKNATTHFFDKETWISSGLRANRLVCRLLTYFIIGS